MDKATIKIKGMSCSACSAAIENALKKTSGVITAAVNLVAEKAVAEFDDSIISFSEIKKIIAKTGYSVIEETEENLGLQEKENKKEKFKLIAAIAVSVPLFYIAMAPMIGFIKLPLAEIIEKNVFIFSLIQLILTVPVILIGYKFYVRGFKNIIKRRANMDSLIAVGTSTSFIYSVFGFKVLIKMSEGDSLLAAASLA